MKITTLEGKEVIGEFDFGQIKKDSKAVVTLLFNSDKLSRFEAEPTCGCTTTEPERVNDNTMKLVINYKNTHIIGAFSKTIKLSYYENGYKKTDKFKIKGEVI